jgi:hypothetical protein
MAVAPPPFVCLGKGNIMVFLPQCVWARVPSTQTSSWAIALVIPMAFYELPKASSSPLQVSEGGSMAKTPSTEVSMTSSSNTTILLLPPALGGKPLTVMAVPMARMPALFEDETPSHGRREDIEEQEDNCIHCNLETNPIVVSPCPRIPP